MGINNIPLPSGSFPPVIYGNWEPNSLVPSFFQGTYGKLFFQIMGRIKDYQIEMTKDAIRNQDPEKCTTDSLPYVGETRNIESYPADTDSTYTARLVKPFTIWNEAGTKQGMTNRLTDFGLTDFTILSWRDMTVPGSPGDWTTFLSSAPEPYGSSGWWSAFWITVNNLHGFAGAYLWGTTLDGGSNRSWGDGAVWGSTAPYSFVLSLAGLVKKWKAATEICPRARFYSSNNYCDSPGLSYDTSGAKYDSITDHFDIDIEGIIIP